MIVCDEIAFHGTAACYVELMFIDQPVLGLVVGAVCNRPWFKGLPYAAEQFLHQVLVKSHIILIPGVKTQPGPGSG